MLKKLTKQDVHKIIEGGNLDSLKKLFGEIGLTDKNDGQIALLPLQREILIDLLTEAFIQHGIGTPHREIVECLIRHISPYINVCQFVNCVARFFNEVRLFINFGDRHWEEIDSTISEALKTNKPSDKVFKKIESMCNIDLFNLIAFINESSEVKGLNRRFCQPIILGLYKSFAVPPILLLGLMIRCFERPEQSALILAYELSLDIPSEALYGDRTDYDDNNDGNEFFSLNDILYP